MKNAPKNSTAKHAAYAAHLAYAAHAADSAICSATLPPHSRRLMPMSMIMGMLKSMPDVSVRCDLVRER